MNWATYAVIIIFGAFVILMILNPNLSCFGRKIASPFYPILRHRKKPPKRIKTQDYGFNLQEDSDKTLRHGQKIGEDEELFLDQFKEKKYKTRDYGFKLTESEETQDQGNKEGNGGGSL